MHAKTILISGAGIAGPTLAFWVKKAGFEPTLIERAPAPRNVGYVVDFWGLGYDIAEKMGLAEHLDRAGYRVRELRIVDERGKRITGFGTRVFEELTHGRYVTIPRGVLSRLLLEKVERTTEVIFGDEIQAIQADPAGVTVAFERGGIRRFDLVIGADGLHSHVRKLAFGPEEFFEDRLGYAVAAFEVRGYRPRDEDIYLVHGRPGRMLGRFTLHDDRTLFLFVFTAGTGSLPATLDERKKLLRDRYAEDAWETRRVLDELGRADDLYFDSVSQIRMKSWSQGRVALVGDAAFCVSLVAGQGSALAMTSAYVLAGELANASGRHDVAFGKYEGLLREYIATKQRAAERFATAFAPKTAWGMHFRNLVIRLMANPKLSKIVAGKGIIDTLRLPQYDW
jgi:2-polyprenyl-6-methoxyphenol hydroxylase-like FAD-dependent oxidoreductase